MERRHFLMSSAVAAATPHLASANNRVRVACVDMAGFRPRAFPDEFRRLLTS